jgi:hypothetical protein
VWFTKLRNDRLVRRGWHFVPNLIVMEGWRKQSAMPGGRSDTEDENRWMGVHFHASGRMITDAWLGHQGMADFIVARARRALANWLTDSAYPPRGHVT